MLLTATATAVAVALVVTTAEGGGCTAALERTCGGDGSATDREPCHLCCGSHQHELRDAGCSASDCEAFCAAASGSDAPNITHIRPARLPVEGIIEVIVILLPSLAGDRAAAAGAASSAACRLVLYDGQRTCSPPDPDSLTKWPAVSFDNPSYGTAVSGRVMNATAIACTPPPVVVEGIAALSASFDGVVITHKQSLPQFILQGRV